MVAWIVSEKVLCPDLLVRPLAVGLDAGRIVELRPLGDPRTDPRCSPEVDAGSLRDFGDSPIVPGWVNAHVHLGMAPLRGITTREARAGNVVQDLFFRVESSLTAEDVGAFTRLAAFESLLCGTTEVWDHYYHAEAAAEALAEVGLSGTVAPTLQDQSGPGARNWEHALATTESLAQSRALTDQGIQAAVGVHASDTVSPALLEQAGALAQRLRLPVHMHLLQHAEEVEASTRTYPQGIVPGVLDRLGEVELIVAHALHASERDIQRLVAARARLAFCPFSQAQFGSLSPIAEWRAAGGSWAVGTDTVASNDSLDLQRELSLLAGLPGLGASFLSGKRELLGAPTESARRQAVQHLEQQRKQLTTRPFPLEPEALLPSAWGFALPGGVRGIQVGAPANLLVLEAQHPALFPDGGLPRALCSGSLSGAIRQVFCRGRAAFPEDGQPLSLLRTPLYLQTLEECRVRQQELFRRALPGLG